MEEAPENGKESSHFVHANGMNELFYHLWPVRLYNIFPHYLVNGMILWVKTLLNMKCMFWFSVQLLSETFLFLRIH